MRLVRSLLSIAGLLEVVGFAVGLGFRVELAELELELELELERWSVVGSAPRFDEPGSQTQTVVDCQGEMKVQIAMELELGLEQVPVSVPDLVIDPKAET